MRITDHMRLTSALSGEATSSSRLNDLTRMASSGLKVDAPSQDPTAFARIVKADGQITLMTARQSNLNQSNADLSLADTQLSSATDLMTRAHTIALQMANGDISASDRANAAQEIDGIRSTLLGLANAQGTGGNYIFGGSQTTTQPFTSAGAFVGNDDVKNVEVADGVTAAANASGAKAFTSAGGNDIFTDLANFSAALTTNNLTGISNAIGTTQAGHDQIVTARVAVGIQSDRLTSASSVIDSALTTVKTARSQDAEIDTPTVLSSLTQTQTAYQQALAVTKQILSMSTFGNS
ncbi:MAG TPA: flagellar hook-associated protein FlgL [Polyangiaceae bacterium]